MGKKSGNKIIERSILAHEKDWGWTEYENT